MLGGTLINSFNATFNVILPVVVNFILALVFLLVGFVVAKIFQWLVLMLFKVLAVDVGVEKLGFTKILRSGNVQANPSELLAAVIFWFIVVITVVTVADAFGVSATHSLLIAVFIYVPKVLAGAIVLAVAIFIANLLRNLVIVAAEAVGLSGAKILSKIVQYAIIIFAFLVAINHMGFDLAWIVNSINVIVGAIGLAVAIAFGLGCKDIAGDFLSNFFRNR